MAFEVEKRAEFTDILSLDWRIDILSDGFSGSIEEMQLSGDPLTIDFLTASDHLPWNPIKGSKADFTVYSDTNFHFADLYAIDIDQYKVKIYYSGTNKLYWQGFILPGNYSEPYNGVSYPVTISASDLLGSLKDILYNVTDPTNEGPAVFYEGKLLKTEIIFQILGKIGVTTFKEFINIYEDDMASTVNDSPLDQSSIDVDLFQGWNCYQVLTAVLNTYNAVIRQYLGEFIIYRPVDLKDSTIYGRSFTDSTIKTAVTISTDQLFSRSTGITDLRDTEGGEMMIQNPSKSIKSKQDYGFKQSWLKNYQFSQDLFTGTIAFGYTALHWSNVDCDLLPMFAVVPNEDNGALLWGFNSYPSLTKYIYQNFGEYAEACSDEIFGFEFEYYWSNGESGTAEGQAFYFSVKMEAGATDYYLQKVADSETLLEWVESGSVLYLNITEDVIQGNSGWNAFTRKFTAIPGTGTLTASFYCLDDSAPNIAIGIKNVRFFGTSDSVSRKLSVRGESLPWWQQLLWLNFDKKIVGYYIYSVKDNPEIIENVYLKTNSIKGTPFEQDYKIGDIIDSDLTNIIEQFLGGIIINVRISLTTAAANFDSAHSSAYSPISLTSSTNHLFFSYDSDFGTTIENTSGDLSGEVDIIAEYIAEEENIWKVYPTNDEGSEHIVANAAEATMTFDTNEETTLANFMGESGVFAAVGLTLTMGEDESGWYAQFSGALSYSVTSHPGSGTFDVSIQEIQEYVEGQTKSVDITLSGSSGTADITCNSITREIEITETVEPSVQWASRGKSEDKPILEIITDEIALQYSRPKQLISGLPILENKITTNEPQINLIGNFQDSLNEFSEETRIFVFNRGTFNVRQRSWEIDIIEVI